MLSDRILISTLILLLAPVAVFGQVAKDAPPASASLTKFETFSTADGRLLITEFFDLSAPAARYGGTTEAHLLHVRDAAADEGAVALQLSYKGTDEYSRERTSVLDADEVESLAKALAFIRTNRDALTADATTYTEITYRSRSGFRTGFYITPEDKTTSTYMIIGGETVFLGSLTGLEATVRAAQARIRQLTN